MKPIRWLLDWLGWERVSETERRHNELIELMALNQNELLSELRILSQQSDKIAAEQAKRFDDLTAVIKKLEDQIRDGTVSPEVEATLAELKTKQQALDDTIPDVLPPAE